MLLVVKSFLLGNGEFKHTFVWLLKLFNCWRNPGPPPSKQIFWWQKCSLGSLFTDSTIRSIIHWSLNIKKSTFQEHSVLRNGASIFDIFFSHFHFILFQFYLFNMKIKYDVRIYSLTSQESINNTSAEGNCQLRPSPRPKRTHRLAEVVPPCRNWNWNWNNLFT